jgi:hypothetical protein
MSASVIETFKDGHSDIEHTYDSDKDPFKHLGPGNSPHGQAADGTPLPAPAEQ